jgi:hypothetical protein
MNQTNSDLVYEIDIVVSITLCLKIKCLSYKASVSTQRVWSVKWLSVRLIIYTHLIWIGKYYACDIRLKLISLSIIYLYYPFIIMKPITLDQAIEMLKSEYPNGVELWYVDYRDNLSENTDVLHNQ